MAAKQRVFLIDGNSFCYRAYYAIRELRTADGRPTNAVYGFITMLRKLIQEEEPTHLGCAFDLEGPTFRHEVYESYKEDRDPMPDELGEQMDVIKEVLEAYRIPIYEQAGFEADDVLATLARRLAKKNVDVFVVTGDKDAMQLVNEHIKVYNVQKDGKVYDAEAVVEQYGVQPDQIVELMALMGDAVDNIPGVPGIGFKTGVKLINQFGTASAVLDNLEEVKSQSQRATLEEHADLVALSHELATAACDVPIQASLGDLAIQEPDVDQLIELFKALEFRSLLRELAPQAPQSDRGNYGYVRTLKELDELVREWSTANDLVFDFETTSTNALDAELVGISLTDRAESAWYIPLRGPEDSSITPLDEAAVLERLTPLWTNPKIRKIAQNLKYETTILAQRHLKVVGPVFDTMVASYVLHPHRNTHKLDDLALEYLGYRTQPIQDLIGKGKHQLRMDEVAIERVSDYACEDSDITWRLFQWAEPMLDEAEAVELFTTIEMPLVEVLAAMEQHGVKLDEPLLQQMSTDLEEQLHRLEQEIYEIAGEEFNIKSHKQLATILFERLELPPVKRTKTGYSTDVEVLETLSEQHALPASLLEYRELAKLKSTYVDALPKLINTNTGRVHTSFNQTVTTTGRLSSSDPNLQNIPIRTELGRTIRRAFVPGERGWQLLSADYSQIELRILAHLSGDTTLCQAFNDERDVHTHTAHLIFETPESKVTPEMRDMAKTVNFGIVYGMGSFGLAKQLNIEISEAQAFIDAYFKRYADVERFLDEVAEHAEADGYVTTLFGRRRYIPELASLDNNVRQAGRRNAINAPIQGTASDIIKRAMIEIHHDLQEQPLDAAMLLQVHDELVFEVAKNDVAALAERVRERMESTVSLDVPLVVNLKVGPNWLDMEPM